MVSNKRFYEIMEILKMVDDSSKDTCRPEQITSMITDADFFANYTCKNLPQLIRFVNELTLFNGIETIQDLLVASLYTGDEKIETDSDDEEDEDELDKARKEIFSCLS